MKLARCRLCSSDKIETVFDLGSQVPAGIFPRPPADEPPARPLRLVRCPECELVQLGDVHEASDLAHPDYGYRSGLNRAMVEHLGGIAYTASSILNPFGETWVDIGSNDGTLLSHLTGTGLNLIGVDPMIGQFAEHYPADVIKIDGFFDMDTARWIGLGTAKVITSIAMLYDLPEPGRFVEAVSYLLKNDGVWICEMSYLPSMIAAGSFDTIVHEHLEYYTLAPLLRLIEAHDMRVTAVWLNRSNGGSIRLAVMRDYANYGTPRIAAVKDLLAKEAGGPDFASLRGSVIACQEAVQEFFLANPGKTIHGYGASTKGNTLLQTLGLNDADLPMIADVNPLKWGCFTPGSHIPIVSEAYSRDKRPDFYFVLIWHFRDQIIAREADYLASGGKLVFPLPLFEVVSAKSPQAAASGRRSPRRAKPAGPAMSPRSDPRPGRSGRA